MKYATKRSLNRHERKRKSPKMEKERKREFIRYQNVIRKRRKGTKYESVESINHLLSKFFYSIVKLRIIQFIHLSAYISSDIHSQSLINRSRRMENILRTRDFLAIHIDCFRQTRDSNLQTPPTNILFANTRVKELLVLVFSYFVCCRSTCYVTGFTER